jgi:hypothetical protein
MALGKWTVGREEERNSICRKKEVGGAEIAVSKIR